MIAVMMLAPACTSTSREPAVPAGKAPRADVVGYPNDIRYYPRDFEDVRQFEEDFVVSWGEERAALGLAPGARSAGRLSRDLGRRRQRRVRSGGF